MTADGQTPVRERFTLLVVEDKDTNRLLLRRALSKFTEWDIHEAVDGEQGLQMVRELRPDLVLLDLRLPRMGGQQVLAEITADEQLRGTLVAVVSAEAAQEQVQEMVAAGCWRYLTKPLDIDSLRATVREAQALAAG